MLEGAGLVNFVNWMVGTENLGPEDIFLQKTPISFDASMREIFPPFFCGARLVVAPPGMQRDTQGLIQIITEQRVTCTSWVPSQLEIFAQVRLSLRWSDSTSCSDCSCALWGCKSYFPSMLSGPI